MFQDEYYDLFENYEYETENPENVPDSRPTKVTKILFSAICH